MTIKTTYIKSTHLKYMIPNTPHSCFIIDDHQLFYDSFSALMHKTNFFSEIYCFDKAITFINQLNLDLKKHLFVFIDYYLEKENALTYIKQIKHISPQAKIIVLSSVSNPIIIKTILEEPIDGFISKTSSMAELKKCITSILNGNTYYCPAITSIIDSSPKAHAIAFCQQEIEALQNFKLGLNIEQIGQAMEISKKLVVKLRNSLMDKTNTASISEVLYFVHKHNISLTPNN